MLFWLLYAHILFWDRNKLKQIHFIFILVSDAFKYLCCFILLPS